MISPPLPSTLSSDLIRLIGAMEESGGAVLVYDQYDRVIWANQTQCRLAPVSDYADETHTSLFWKLYDKELIGNSVAKECPATWVEKAKIARRLNHHLEWVSQQKGVDFIATHYYFPSGICIQSRAQIQAGSIAGAIHSAHPIESMKKLSEFKRRMGNLSYVLDCLGMGFCIVGVDLTISFANTEFMDKAASGEIILDNDGRKLRFSDPQVDAAFASAVMAVALGQTDRKIIVTSKNSSCPEIGIVTTCPSNGNIMLLTSSKSDDYQHVSEVIEKSLSVNPSEAYVAALVGAGFSPPRVAEYRSTAEGTVYNQIKMLKSKLKNSPFEFNDLIGLAGIVSRISSLVRISLVIAKGGAGDQH